MGEDSHWFTSFKLKALSFYLRHVFIAVRQDFFVSSGDDTNLLLREIDNQIFHNHKTVNTKNYN